MGTFDDLYILLRETIEPNETIEQCLKRGLEEEFGAQGNLKSYLGSIVTHFPFVKDGPIVEKTTLYFLCELISIDESKRKKDDPESSSEIKWLDPSFLILKMKEQRTRFKREDVDESVILERVRI